MKARKAAQSGSLSQTEKKELYESISSCSRAKDESSRILQNTFWKIQAAICLDLFNWYMTRLLPTNLYCSHKLDNILLFLCPWCHGCWYYPMKARNLTCLRCCCGRTATWRGEVQISRICSTSCQSGSALLSAAKISRKKTPV
jgi:hypothetical protein